MECNRDLRSEECFTTLQSDHSKRKQRPSINRKWKNHLVRVDSISPRVAELVLCLTKCYKLKIVQLYAPTTSYSEEDINKELNRSSGS